MARVSKPTTKTTISSSWAGDLIDDYVSQTETGYTQTIPLVTDSTYTVRGAAPTVYVRNNSTGEVTTYATELAALEYCRDNGPAEGTTVFIKAPFKTSTADVFTVNRSNFSIITGLNPGYADYTADDGVLIHCIKLDSSTAQVEDCYFQGLKTVKIWFYSHTNHVARIVFEQCSNWCRSGNAEGIIFDGDAWLNYIYFNDCHLTPQAPAVGYGAVTFKNTAWGTGQIYFSNLRLVTIANNVTLFYVVNASVTDAGVRLDGHIHVDNTGCKFLHIDSDGAGDTVFNADFRDFEFLEFDENTTMVTIENPSGTVQTALDFHDNRIFIDDGVTLTLITNNASAVGDWRLTTPVHCLLFHHNRIFYNTGTFTIGTPAQNADFNVEVSGNRGFNPVAASTPAVGGSPVTFGPYVYPMQISVVGGTITSVTNRGQVTGQAGAGTARDYTLYPGDTCVIVYAVVPVVYLQPQ